MNALRVLDLILFMIVASKGLENSCNISKRQVFFTDFIKSQNMTKNIIVISNDLNLQTGGHAITVVEPKKLNDGSVHSLVEGLKYINTRSIFIIDGFDSKADEIKNFVFSIRRITKDHFIIVFKDEIIHNIGYNIYFVIMNAKGGIDILELCAYCNNGEDIFRQINSWAPSLGFAKEVNLHRSFKGNFYGRKLVVSCFITPVIFYSISKDAIGNPLWAGSEYDFLSLLGTIMNFTADIRPNYHVQDIRSLKKIHDGKADLGVGGIGFHPHYAQLLDFSPATGTAQYKIVTNEPPRGLKFFSFLLPFTWKIWLGIVISLPLSGMILFVLDNREVQANIRVKRKSYWTWLWILIQIILWDRSTVAAHSTTKICLLAPFLFASTIVIMQYFGLVTACCIALQPYEWKVINTLEELEKTNLKLLTRKKPALTSLLKSNDKQISKLPNHLFGFANLSLLMMLNSPNVYSVIVLDEVYELITPFLFGDIERKIRFHIGSESIGEYRSVFWFRKDVVYKNDFISKMLHLQSMGFNHFYNYKHKDIFLRRATARAKMKNGPENIDKFAITRLKHMLRMFSFTVLCYGMACLMFICEKVWFNFKIDMLFKKFYFTSILLIRSNSSETISMGVVPDNETQSDYSNDISIDEDYHVKKRRDSFIEAADKSENRVECFVRENGSQNDDAMTKSNDENIKKCNTGKNLDDIIIEVLDNLTTEDGCSAEEKETHSNNEIRSGNEESIRKGYHGEKIDDIIVEKKNNTTKTECSSEGRITQSKNRNTNDNNKNIKKDYPAEKVSNNIIKTIDETIRAKCSSEEEKTQSKNGNTICNGKTIVKDHPAEKIIHD